MGAEFYDAGSAVAKVSYRRKNRRVEGACWESRGCFPGETAAWLDLWLKDAQRGGMTFQPPTPLPKRNVPPEQVSFDRAELGVILSLYGKMVAAGEWRDYGMSFLRDRAVFSVFRRTAEHPIYRIEKTPKLRGRQGQYSVISMEGQILKRGSDLRTVLRVLERKLIRAVD